MSGKSGRCFCDLEVYKRYEKISDVLWKVIFEWTYEIRELIGHQLLRAIDSVGGTSPRQLAAVPGKTEISFFSMRVDRLWKRNTGFEEQHASGSSPPKCLKHCEKILSCLQSN